MLKDLSIQKKVMHFCEPFQIAYEKVDKAEIIVIKITDDRGNIGLGSAAPDEEVTGETISSVYKILNNKLSKDFFNRSFDDWYFYHEKIQQIFSGFPSAQAAIEESLLNLFCARNNISLVNLFGGFRQTCPIAFTIGIKSVDETLAETKLKLKEGYKIIKLKCGLDVDSDIIKITRIQKLLSKDCLLALDANQGYSMADAKKLLLSLNNSKIEFIEQPIKSTDLAGLKKLRQFSSIPIVADEAAVTVADAINLLNNDYVDGINIKLMKCGGPINFLKIFNLAKSLGKKVIIGCMYESQISLTTGASLALALPIDYVDLDSGRLDFPDDPATGGVFIRRGQIEKIDKLRLK